MSAKNEENMTDKEWIIAVAKKLRSMCDGARTEDGVGFNKYDARKVRSLLQTYEKYGDDMYISKWKQLKKALIKYKGQIQTYGFNYDRLPQIKFMEENKVEHEDVKFEIKTNGDTELWIYTPYNKQFVNDIKKVNKYDRGFDRPQKAWVITIRSDKKSAKKAIEIVEDNFDVEIDIELPDVSFGEAKIEGNYIAFDTEYNDDFKNQVKNDFEDRKFDKSINEWLVKPTSLDEVDRLYDIIDEWDIEYESDVQMKIDEIKEKLMEEQKEHQRLVELSKQKSLESDYDVPLPDDDLELYDFQKYAVKMMDEREKCLLADDMGAGKTVEVLAHLYNRQERRPVIVIVPSSVKINWKREIQKWTEAEENDIEVLRGFDGDITEGKDWYVVNYAILRKRIDDLKKIDYKAIVFDESHYIKNHEAQRTKSALELAEEVEHIYALSGTPMPNRPIELWTQLQALQPDEGDFKSLWRDGDYEGFARKYCNARKTRFGWDVKGSSNLNELYKKLRESIMVRRQKEDVVDELPEKRRISFPLEIDNKEEYNEAVRNFKNWMKDKEPENTDWQKAEHLAKIEKLKQLAVEGKKENMMEWLNDMVEQDGKIVIFAHHRELQDEIYQEFEEKAVKITGGMDSDRRQDTIDEFTDGDAEVCVVSLLAGGEGINLQVASRAVFAELNWTPKEHNQAEDRIHRIGQDEQCDVYYLMGENTIEEEIFELINTKQERIDEAIDGVTDESEKGMIVDLVKKMEDE